MNKICFFIFLLSFTAACSRPLSNPHLNDPRYLYYKNTLEDIQKEKDKISPEITKLEIQTQSQSLRSSEKRDLLDNLFELKKKFSQLDEKSLYFSQKLSHQITIDREEYKKAFADKKTWPDPETIKAFNLEISAQKARGKELKIVEWDEERRMKAPAVKKAEH